VNVPDDGKFDDAVDVQRKRDHWNWKPDGETSTNCVFAAETALHAGGAGVEATDWLPRGLGDQLQGNPAATEVGPDGKPLKKSSSAHSGNDRGYKGVYTVNGRIDSAKLNKDLNQK
jgi:hypothetical protein